jgi:hypothetical protein
LLEVVVEELVEVAALEVEVPVGWYKDILAPPQQLLQSM